MSMSLSTQTEGATYDYQIPDWGFRPHQGANTDRLWSGSIPEQERRSSEGDTQHRHCPLPYAGGRTGSLRSPGCEAQRASQGGRPMTAKFTLGHIVATPAALKAIADSGQAPSDFL